MPVKTGDLGNEAAVQALSLVAASWISQRGLEFHAVCDGARSRAGQSFAELPAWATAAPNANDESGDLARRMLGALMDCDDDEVNVWAHAAVEKVQTAKAFIDPLTLGIGGAILIGAILAARVKKIGSATFYKGIPKSLANVLKAAAGVAGINPLGAAGNKGRKKKGRKAK